MLVKVGVGGGFNNTRQITCVLEASSMELKIICDIKIILLHNVSHLDKYDVLLKVINVSHV